ncbi:hypothetical protein [Kitasatospora sp. NPDC017646]|uniref:hypothetical protein n=1 Tax=Kitasatospora sp. NPDC017646 TaxID=3364024 RepID=UPI0037984953
MSTVGEASVVPEGEEQIEYGRCTVCGRWVYGRFIQDITAYVAEVEHCPSRDTDPSTTSPTH